MPRWYAGSDTARRIYYDRDPIPIYAAYGGTVGPHGLAVRASYTPPIGYAAFIEVISFLNVRHVLATTPVFSTTELKFYPFYGGVVPISIQLFPNNVTYQSMALQLTGYGYLAYGDVLEIATQNLDAGGTVQFQATLKGTEFLY